MLGDGFPIMDHASVVLAGIVAVLESGGTGRVRCTPEEGGINANKAREIGSASEVGGGGGLVSAVRSWASLAIRGRAPEVEQPAISVINQPS